MYFKNLKGNTMNTKKVLFAIVAVVFCIFNSNAQINLLSNAINFRTNSTFAASTWHYGDLRLDCSPSWSWGWLEANYIESKGNLQVNGNFTCSGTKSFIQAHPTDTSKLIAYVAIEAGEALTVARGMSVTKGGKVEIPLPEHFFLVTSADIPVTVLLTPEKSPALLYVAQKSKEKIVVAEKSADYSEFGDVDFSYQVTGVRDGFEDYKVIRDVSNVDDTTGISLKRKALMEKSQTMFKAKWMAKEKVKMEQVQGKK
jgi:hypothetical protein